MATRTTRIRVVTALLTATLIGFGASLAMGQSRMANPRFRRRAAATQPVTDPLVTERSRIVVRQVPEQTAPTGRPRNPRPTEVRQAESISEAPQRAQQALWHVQSARERHAASAPGAPQDRSFGFQPKHERMAGIVNAPKSRRVVGVQHQSAIEGSVVDGSVLEGSVVEGDANWSEAVPHDGASEYYDGVVEGETIVDGEGWAGDVAYEYGDEICDCSGGCFDCMGSMPPAAIYGMGDVTLFFGKQGFINGLNQGASGSFGYNEGFNLGTALPFFPYSGWGFQIGLRGTQSNLSGSAQTTQRRDQTFFTTGIFKRSDWGFQCGVVVDVLNDNWVGDVKLTQARGEISWVKANTHEFGYWFAASGDRDTIAQGLVSPQALSVTDVQGFFYRIQSSALPGATGRFVAGWSNDSDGLLAGETQIPLSRHFSMLTTATYLIPNEGRGNGGAQNEVWNLGMNLVFSFRGAAANCSAPFAPLFRVADNGSFFVDSN